MPTFEENDNGAIVPVTDSQRIYRLEQQIDQLLGIINGLMMRVASAEATVADLKRAVYPLSHMPSPAALPGAWPTSAPPSIPLGLPPMCLVCGKSGVSGVVCYNAACPGRIS